MEDLRYVYTIKNNPMDSPQAIKVGVRPFSYLVSECAMRLERLVPTEECRDLGWFDG